MAAVYTASEHGARLTSAAEAPAAALAAAAALGAAGSYVPHVAATYPLGEIGEVHASSQAGHTRGMLVVKP